MRGAGSAAPGTSRQTSPSAAFSPSESLPTSVGERDPTLFVSFALSSVVTWWQSATLAFPSPPAPAGIPIAVGPVRAVDVESGTTTTDLQVGMALNPSWDATTTGLRPRCSDPDRSSSSAQ